MSGNGASTNTTENDGESQRAAGGSRRFPAPAELKNATAFAQDGEVRSSRWLFETVHNTALLGEDFLASMRISNRRGPKRGEVDWVLLYFDFVVSDSVDVQPWHEAADDALFRAAGCQSRPSCRTVYNRFVELEQLADVLEAAAAKLIQNARRFEPRIGMYVHVDSTEAETHAALVHDCAPSDPDCRVWKERRTRVRRRTERQAAWGVSPSDPLDDDGDAEDDDPEHDVDAEDAELEIARSEKRPQRLPTATVRELRHKATTEAPPEQLNDENDGDPADEEQLDEGVQATATEGRYRRVQIGGCWYRTLDKSAGIRAYTNARGTTRFWHGFYNTKAIDHCTHAPVAVLVTNASTQEFDLYPGLLDHVERNVGVRPRAVVADRGFSIKKVFRWNTERGIASVIHWRKATAAERKRDTARYDRHGVPRCTRCGGPTEFVRFNHEPTPRIWFRCTLSPTQECRGVQSIACSADWRALVPLRRDDPVYLELRRSHKSFEAVHDYWRDRYKVAAADIGQRPKRTGDEWQQLRANAALLIEWLRMSHLHGWLGGGRVPCRASQRLSRGNEAAVRMLQFRTRIGLDSYYGPAAVGAFSNRRLRRSPSEIWELRQRWEKRCKARAPKRRRGASSGTPA
jgi:hypothetical protein